MACIWDALGYLDGINEDQNFHTKEFVKVLTALELMDMRLKQMWQPLQQTLEQVKKIQAAVNTMLSLTTVTIPGWMTKSEVLDGINRVAIDGGKSPTAAECGLIVDFVVDAQRHDVPGWIMSTAPPRGTVVLRVSKVTVVHQAEE
jgi:hypothetical protein